MRQDIRPNEIDCIFCWRTSTGDVRDGARDTKYNGQSVPYGPQKQSVRAGLHTSVTGRPCAHRPTGPRLDEQGAISRMACFTWGHVTRATVVPARNARELATLRKDARAAVVAGHAVEWALAAIYARGHRHLAVHIGASAAVVVDFAARVDAPWTLQVREKMEGTWMNGAQIVCVSRGGDIVGTLEGDTLFAQAPLPRPGAFAP